MCLVGRVRGVGQQQRAADDSVAILFQQQLMDGVGVVIQQWIEHLPLEPSGHGHHTGKLPWRL